MAQTNVPEAECRVDIAAKLPAAAGGADEICTAIRNAVRSQAPQASVALIDVRVPSPAKIAATVTLKDGRKLPEQTMAISDGVLNGRAIERFARAVADQIGAATAS